MTYWTNHVTINATGAGSHTVNPSNPTAIGTVIDGSAFTPTSGRLLVIIAAGPVTSSTPSGWTLPSGGSAVSTDGLYVFYKTAAGSDTAVIGHNSGAYHVIFDIYEFPSTASFGSSAAFAAAASGSTKTLSGLSGSNLVMSPICSPGAAGNFTFSGATETFEALAADNQSRYAIANTYSSASSVGVAATSASHEQLVFSIAGIVVAETGSIAATLPKPTLTLSGTYRDVGSLAIALPKPALALTGSYIGTEAGSFDAELPLPALDLAGDYTAPPHPLGTFDLELPVPNVELVGSYTGPVPTDTSNAFNGLSVTWTAAVSATQAVSQPPVPSSTTRVDKAIPLPVPVLEKGRPT